MVDKKINKKVDSLDDKLVDNKVDRSEENKVFKCWNKNWVSVSYPFSIRHIWEMGL